jgi:hypothetical protein
MKLIWEYLILQTAKQRQAPPSEKIKLTKDTIMKTVPYC